MKKYDISDNIRERIFTIKVSFQYQEYKGHIAYEVGGNCRGLNVMEVDFDFMDQDQIKNLKENTCGFCFDEQYQCYKLKLKNNKGEILEIDDIIDDEINDYVVGVQIIDCKIV